MDVMRGCFKVERILQ